MASGSLVCELCCLDASAPICNEFLRFTFDVTPTDHLIVSMHGTQAFLIHIVHVHRSIGGICIWDRVCSTVCASNRLNHAISETWSWSQSQEHTPVLLYIVLMVWNFVAGYFWEPHPTPLLDKVMSRNQWYTAVHQCHLMFKGHLRASNKTIYMVTKRRCVWTKHLKWAISCFLS